MIPDGLQLIAREAQHQNDEWGVDHDLLEHGSDRLLAAATVVLDGFEGQADESSVPWAVALHEKHKDNPVRRAMIAGALCASAINVRTFEIGQAQRAGLEQP